MRFLWIGILALSSLAANAQNYTEGDLYRLLNEIERSLDEITPNRNQVQRVAQSLEDAKNELANGGSPTANLVISESPTFNFGTVAVGSGAERTITLSNTGLGFANHISAGGLNRPFGFKGGTYPGTGGTCGRSLGAGLSCTIILSYSPTSVGMANDTLEVGYHDGMSGQLATRGLTGTAVTPASLSLSNGPTVDFGKVAVGTYTEQTVILSNSGGTMAYSISAEPLNGAFSIAGGTCGNSLSPAASCTIVVRFTPTAAGLEAATLNFLYSNGVTAQVVSRVMVGTGL